MMTAGLWVGIYLLVLALIVSGILQKLQRKRREKAGPLPKRKTTGR
jgi:hypothetical protein